MTESMRKLEDLPPLPLAQRKEQQRQECIGCAVVLGTTILLVATTQVASDVELTALTETAQWACRGCIYASASLAAVCLVGLMVADPGIVHRSADACWPIPQHIEEKLQQGHPLEGNVPDGYRSFCVRCLVWRDPDVAPTGCNGRIYLLGGFPRKPHHCSICQRCVTHFDHHCNVFGRCIGAGNVGYFCGLIIAGVFGGLTTTVTLALAFFLSWNVAREQPGLVLPACALLVLCCCWRRICHLLRSLVRCCLLLRAKLFHPEPAQSSDTSQDS
mmetsp:Transcript_49629/g.118222  ORF Transcript_49629/g.118222 Transcript_49629/m.118222 type:complete len:273 (+) Transcript_49629:145-963(+)